MNDPKAVVYLAINNPKNTIQYVEVVAAPMVCCGEYETVEKAGESIVRVRDEVTTDREIAELYKSKFETYKKIYQQLKRIYDSYN